MKTIVLIATTLTVVASGIAAAATPEFHSLAGGKTAATAKGGPVMRTPQAQTIAAPLVSETQAIPNADGGIDIRCREVPNPRLRETDAQDQPGPRR